MRECRILVKKDGQEDYLGSRHHMQCHAWVEGRAIHYASTRTPTWLKVPV